jgi:uncharacterized protein YjiS (DUF1127 family)|tara:strand:+ start:826 stop:1011 length:186 start_codon:yes stop_codon:yes gene_type:complete
MRLAWGRRLFNYYSKRCEHRKVIKHLNELTDRELSDIGITRGDIDNLVWNREDHAKRGKKE